MKVWVIFKIRFTFRLRLRLRFGFRLRFRLRFRLKFSQSVKFKYGISKGRVIINSVILLLE